MKRIFLSIAFSCVCYVLFAQNFSYRFNSSFAEANGGRSLNEVFSCGATSGSYTTQTITTASGNCSTPSTVFNFGAGGGVAFPNTDNVIGSTYTIHLFFTITQSLSGYTRLVDFSNSGSDAGIYILGNCLNFFPSGNVGPSCPFVQNQFALLTLVRDGATGTITVYVNGTLFTSYSDVNNRYVPTATAPLLFFRDDNAVACESKAGLVKYLFLSNTVSSAADVSTAFSSICTLVLPVTWGNVTAVRNDKLVRLNWNTKSEQNSHFFEVQRSTDGQNFTAIGSVQSQASATGATYAFTDVSATAEITYYRIRQVDKDGKQTFSTVVKADRIKNGLSVYPNPVTDNLVVSKLNAGNLLILSTLDGRPLQQKTVKESTTILPMGHLPAGMYLLRCRTGNEWVEQKIIKQ